MSKPVLLSPVKRKSYSANFRALIEGGVSAPAQQIELISTLVQAETSKGVSGMQALKDSIDIFNGRASQIVIAKELGLTSEELKKAAENGTQYSYIMGKLGGYQEAAAASADSYKGSLQTVRNELEQLEGQVAKPVFDRLIAILGGGKGALGSPEASGVASGIGNTLAGVLEDVQSKTSAVESFLGSHPMMAKLLGLAPSIVAGVDDPAAAQAADKHEKAVNTLAAALQKTYKFSEETARKEAEIVVTRNENTRAAAALNKELDGIVDKEDRAAKSADIAAKLKGVYGSILPQLPEAARAGLRDQPGDDNLGAVTTAVQALPEGDKAAIEAKKTLVDLLKDAVRLQHDYNSAVSKEEADKKHEGRDDKHAEKNAAAIADENLNTQILEARARGEDDIANKLEKQRDIQKEINRLKLEGVSDADAQAQATRNVDAQNTIQDKKDAARVSHKGGGDGSFWINGYATDTDPGGGLHTGGLTTGGLGPGGASATSTAGHALDHPNPFLYADPSAALANPTAHGFSDPSAALNAAASPFAPAAPRTASVVGPALAGGQSGGQAVGTAGGPTATAGGSGNGGDLTGPLNRVATAADGAKDKSNEAAQAADRAATAMKGAQAALGTLGTKIAAIETEIQTLTAKCNTLAN